MVLYQTYRFFCTLFNLIGYHGNQKAKFAHKKILKNQLLRSCVGDKAETKVVSNISFYKNIVVVFLLPMLKLFGCYGNLLKVTIDFQWEKWK